MKYEFMMYRNNQYMVSKNLPRLQNDGWEIAGQITTKFADNNSGYDQMLIPLKRKILKSKKIKELIYKEKAAFNRHLFDLSNYYQNKINKLLKKIK